MHFPIDSLLLPALLTVRSLKKFSNSQSKDNGNNFFKFSLLLCSYEIVEKN
jgi:hypothetical protein